MISVIHNVNVVPHSEAIAWGGTVQNGMSCVMTHIPESDKNGMAINATDNNHSSQENVQHQPSSGVRSAIPCENSIPCEGSIQVNHDVKNYQNYRKNNLAGKNALVENLVDKTVSIINVIWYNFPVHLNSQVIPLRLFIQETLRRSRTSWSTLQTALFYLMKIKPQIKILWLNPDRWTLNKGDNNNSNSNNNSNQGSDPATCGRRMFLASLIIASKYLQDRNYANNAWSKICGLPVQEINVIERRFLSLIDYNLFIGEDVYKNWTNLLRTQFQNIPSGPAENQQDVAQFEKTLQQPQVVECKVQG
uniref:G1/S-specific cyclin pas1 n=1 Tax=Anthurium amnicola TaxID=1678845 RepID=A0A1D1Y301_9ARAE